MELVREAAGLEGLIVLAIIYFVLNGLQKAGEKARRSRPSGPPLPEPDRPTATQEEGFSLEGILREIERVKAEQEQRAKTSPSPPAPRPLPQAKRPKPLPPPRQAPTPMRRPPPTVSPRGPMGRHAERPLPPAEEVEERESLEGRSLEVEESLEVLDETRLRPPPVPVDRDDDAERVVEERIRAAEQRNRPHAAADHRVFDEQVVRARSTATAAPVGRSRASLRSAFIWKEILGPPKALEE